MNWRKLLWIGAGGGAALLAVGALTIGTVPWYRTDDASGGMAPANAATGSMKAATSGAPKRIVSINLCTDQLLIAVADRDQIAGVTQFATDPRMSAMAQAAKGLPVWSHEGETLLIMAPDMLIGGPASGTPAARFMGDRVARVVDVPFVRSYTDIVDNLRQVGRETGHPQRAEAIISDMERQLAPIGKIGGNRVAAYYQRRGFMTGAGTLVDDMLQRLGLENLANRLGKSELAQLSVEEMVAANPDFLILEARTGPVRDQGSEMLDHPALSNIPRLIVGEGMTVCGGPEYPLAIQSLAAQIIAHDRMTGAAHPLNARP